MSFLSIWAWLVRFLPLFSFFATKFIACQLCQFVFGSLNNCHKIDEDFPLIGMGRLTNGKRKFEFHQECIVILLCIFSASNTTLSLKEYQNVENSHSHIYMNMKFFIAILLSHASQFFLFLFHFSFSSMQ